MEKGKDMTKYTITEEQLLIYVHGERKAHHILNSDFKDHYSVAFRILNQGQPLVWNWAAFFFGPLWFMESNYSPPPTCHLHGFSHGDLPYPPQGTPGFYMDQ